MHSSCVVLLFQRPKSVSGVRLVDHTGRLVFHQMHVLVPIPHMVRTSCDYMTHILFHVVTAVAFV